jgi:sulfite exporter TauE/SafE
MIIGKFITEKKPPPLHALLIVINKSITSVRARCMFCLKYTLVRLERDVHLHMRASLRTDHVFSITPCTICGAVTGKVPCWAHTSAHKT